MPCRLLISSLVEDFTLLPGVCVCVCLYLLDCTTPLSFTSVASLLCPLFLSQTLPVRVCVFPFRRLQVAFWCLASVRFMGERELMYVPQIVWPIRNIPTPFCFFSSGYECMCCCARSSSPEVMLQKPDNSTCVCVCCVCLCVYVSVCSFYIHMCTGV